MKTVLKVVGGKNDGREIAIAVPKFIIGRGEKAHLRPSSDLVSRHHCVIRVRDGKVSIEDLKSRNGTFVNGEKIEGRYVAKAGDKLRVGRLQLEVVIDHAVAGAKKPAISGVADAAARTASSKQKKEDQSLDESISDWLLDDDDSPSISNAARFRSDETVQMNLDETTQIKNPIKKEEPDPDETVSEDQTIEAVESEDSEDSGKAKKSRFGKLPTRAVEEHESSTHAADDVLKKFFNRR